MRLHQRHRGEPASVGDAENSGSAVVVGDVLDQPIDGVISVGSFVDRVGLGPVARRALHHELAFGIVAAADVLEHENEPFIGELLVAILERVFGLAPGEAVRRALHQQRQFRGGILRRVNEGVKANAVAHGDHDFGFVPIGGVARRAGGEGEEEQKCGGLHPM